MFKKLIAAVLVAAALLASDVKTGGAGEPWLNGQPIICGADNIAATLTELTGCAVPAISGLRYYITSVVAQSTTTTGGQFALRSGTGTNCGTGTANILPGSVGTARYSSPANTVNANVIVFTPPVAVTPGHALCVLGVATNTTTITVTGYLAP